MSHHYRRVSSVFQNAIEIRFTVSCRENGFVAAEAPGAKVFIPFVCCEIHTSQLPGIYNRALDIELRQLAIALFTFV